MNWLITYNGLTQTFAARGLSNLRRTRVSQAQDTVSFTCPGPYDTAELFPFGSIVEISFQPASGDNVRWFYGKVIQVPRSGSGTEENMDYILAGPWWHLDNLVYQQAWSAGRQVSPYTLADGESKLGEETVDEILYDLIGIYKSRVILGQAPAGTRLNSGQVITDVINYAIAAGAPIALGTIEPDLDIPWDEQNDITCAEAIRRMLRWSPDAIAWFDYSTTPYPTFHCKRRDALTSLSLSVIPEESGIQSISALQIIPRPDIQVPAVVLKFEQVNTINDVDYESITTQKFPLTATGREFGALTATLQLAGTQATILSQKIKAKTIDLIADTFWLAHDDTYKNGTNDIMVTAVLAGTHSPAVPPYLNELIEGQIQDWMTGIHFEEVVYTATALVTIYDNAAHDNIIKKELKTLSCKIIATDACGVIPPPGEKTKTYTRLTNLVSGETVPAGLAESIYNSLNPLQYDGKLNLVEEECLVGASLVEARAHLGLVLNLTGGMAAWSTMNAVIQEITENVDSGQTSISFGPPEQLSIQDLMEFLRANRGRGVAFSFKKRENGQSASGVSSVDLSGPTPLLNTAGASGQTKLLTVLADSTKKIVLNPDLITAAGAVELKPVAASVMVSGVLKTINVLASEAFAGGGEVSGFTGTVTVISAFQWSSSSLQYKTKALTYANGLLTSVGTESGWNTLFTASSGCPA